MNASNLDPALNPCAYRIANAVQIMLRRSDERGAWRLIATTFVEPFGLYSGLVSSLDVSDKR